jgi:hypothetical protein
VNPVTLRNLPPQVARVVRKRAQERRTSVNKAVIELLEEGLGLAGKTPKLLHHDLDALAGSWTKRESRAFDEALVWQRGIDPDVWK